MCGIVGYIGKKNVIDVLLDGLYSLEYRGYDSAGICISNGTNSEIIKSVGRVSLLEEKIKSKDRINSFYGIAHTRWATNGEANEINAHPHKVGKVTIVHNGIIENSDILKERLIKEGYSFDSDTDTIVVAALIDFYLKETDSISAINKAVKELTGSYALGIIIDNEKCLYAIRKDSPLIIGIGTDEFFLASDITAISKLTKNYILLGTNELAVLNTDNYKIYKDGEAINKEVLTTDSEGFNIDKDGYEHFMMKEIMEEPVVVKRLIDRYSDKKEREKLDLSKYKEVDIVGCGSAKYAGMVGSALLEEYALVKANVYSASEYRYKKKIYNTDTLVILISQSGETADTIAALREAKELGVETLGIVNNPDSTIAREADNTILIEAGIEVAVATTKAYVAQVLILSLMAFQTAKTKKLTDISYTEYLILPKKLKEVLYRINEYREVANKIYQNDNIYFIGRGIDYSICMEGSLKLKEISYIHSEAYEAGELKHGTISLIEENTPVVAVITLDRLRDKTMSNLKETLARGALGIIVTNDDIEISDILSIKVPKTTSLTSVILTIPTLQLLAYFTAKKRGCDIDKPRNLAKSVTVE